ncbi:MAG TPA: ABC transporter permease [Candidatus Acidoferrales bacterium]|nr:ABC transporter permease [Candidatus Acidoferrales bacterium]
MMLNRETWAVALDALRANKMRAVLTMLGVMIGSACIVLVVTVSLTGREFIVGRIESIGTNVISANVEVTINKAQSLSEQISLDDMGAIKAAIPHVTTVAGMRQVDMSTVINGVEHPVSLTGVTENYDDIRHLVMLSGRYFDHDDMIMRNKVCLITVELANKIYGSQAAVGQLLRLGELQFTVVGVFRERVSTYGLSEINQNTVLIPFPLVQYYTGDDRIRNLYVQMANPEDVEPATARVRELLLSRHPPGSSYQVENLNGILDIAKKISLALSISLLVIALIALVVSGIGIMNIMLVTVTERTREIGIRRAIGARQREILYQFLLESALISGVGAVLGVLIGVTIPVLVQPLLPEGIRIPVPWLAVVVALAVSSFTGIFFGYLPANKAAALNPVESLRYE